MTVLFSIGTSPKYPKWLYPILAVLGFIAGIFVLVVYPGWLGTSVGVLIVILFIGSMIMFVKERKQSPTK